MPTLKLEILRHGPPQNQLLSPLTEYLALCADQPASTVRMPFEHAVLLERLRDLAYTDLETGDGRRESRLRSLAQEIGSVFAQVPGLIAECSRHALNNGELLHLRLVLSSNELALLPFELALGPTGFPGAGEHLTLQTVAPVCVTREVRRAAPAELEWPSRCKILFAAAAPSGVPEVPTEAHLLALLKALDGWMPHPGTGRQVDITREHLTLLPRATLREITDACRTGEYTHVHILAHGVPFQAGDDRRFGLALHSDRDRSKADIVNGERLSAALRAHTLDRSRELARPSVVTLCSCDSGNVGSIVGAGASLAHELHAAGVPLVVASQFPLSIEGSVHLTCRMYPALLRGDDPRLVIDDVRRALRALVPERHDWASIVAYSSLPSDIERQLRRTRREQAARAIHAALSHLDAESRTLPSKRRKSGATPHDPEKSIRAAEDRVREPLAILEYLLERDPSDTDIRGLLASAKKRLGEVYYRGSHAETSEPTERQLQWRELAETHLRKAYRAYCDVFEIDHTATWALVQAIMLGLAIGRPPERSEVDLARLLSQRNKNRPGLHGVWARRNMLELTLLDAFFDFPESNGGVDRQWLAQERMRDLLLEVPDSELVSLRGQLDRYRYFFVDKVMDEANEKSTNTMTDLSFRNRIESACAELESHLAMLIAELDSHEGRQGVRQ